MNKVIKAKWLKVLRSGEYSQTRGKLRGNGRYCCLGVLCDIVDKNGWGVRFISKDPYPSKSVLEKSKLKLRDCFSLSNRNDGDVKPKGRLDDSTRGWNFKEIADYIEEKF